MVIGVHSRRSPAVTRSASPESGELLQFLFRHSTGGRFTYRHRWQEHDLVFWDNRCTVHLAHGCPPELRRHMHRTTVQGDAPF